MTSLHQIAGTNCFDCLNCHWASHARSASLRPTRKGDFTGRVTSPENFAGTMRLKFYWIGWSFNLLTSQHTWVLPEALQWLELGICRRHGCHQPKQGDQHERPSFAKIQSLRNIVEGNVSEATFGWIVSDYPTNTQLTCLYECNQHLPKRFRKRTFLFGKGTLFQSQPIFHSTRRAWGVGSRTSLLLCSNFDSSIHVFAEIFCYNFIYLLMLWYSFGMRVENPDNLREERHCSPKETSTYTLLKPASLRSVPSPQSLKTYHSRSSCKNHTFSSLNLSAFGKNCGKTGGSFVGSGEKNDAFQFGALNTSHFTSSHIALPSRWAYIRRCSNWELPRHT